LFCFVAPPPLISSFVCDTPATYEGVVIGPYEFTCI